MEIISNFTVTDFKTGEQFEEAIEGFGQDAIAYLRGQYPRYSKFVLTGFEVDGAFKKLNLQTYNTSK